jgi:serine protease
VPAGETLVADVETEVSGEPDTLLGIYDADGQQVAFNDDYSGRESRALYSSTAGGTYFVVIAPWDAINPDNATTGDYGLMLTSHLNPPAQ